jgi:hypothetical protein
METLRSAVVPVASAYLLIAGIVLYAAKHPEPAAPSRHRVEWRPRLILIGATVFGGYLVFLAIVLVFHVWLVGQRGVMWKAIVQGLFLAATSVLAFVLLSTMERRHQGRR